MGNVQGSEEGIETKRASNRFDPCEIRVLKETFKDLSHLSGESKRIDKETFLQYFSLPGLLGERLFAVFDKKHIGEVDYEEFICGLAVTCKGTWVEKVEFIFNIYDVHNVGAVSRDELSALLNHVPKSVMKLGRELHLINSNVNSFSLCESLPSIVNENSQSMYALNLNMNGNASNHATASDGSAEHDRTDEEMSHEGDENIRTVQSVDHPYHHHYAEFTNADIVDQAFDECDLDHDGKLSFNEFRLWMERTPYVAHFLQSVFPYDEYRDWDGDSKHLPFIHNRDLASVGSRSPEVSPRESDRGEPSRDEAIRLLLRIKRLTANPEIISTIDGLIETFRMEEIMSGSDIRNRKPGLANGKSPESIALQIQQSLSPRTARALQHQTVAKKGFLSKRGSRLKSWKQRWYMLVGNCIYYYQHQHHKTPRGVIFLAGSFVEPIHEEENERRQHWGLEISRTQEHGLRRCLYASSRVERDRWVHELRRASKVIPIEEDFEIGQELGKGQFSKVCLCTNKHNLQSKAVKIIEKETMGAEEKELLRAEIAIMKLVNHPNIIRMEAVYESRQQIFIVMELHSGGELFDRVNGRPRLTEDEAFCVIYPLIESVAYLHEMGIVHRDLKPENILCGKKIGDIKIADFGLSKLVLPHEIMKMPCGTLSYVAPEVLTLNGYGREADMWSVGTIMYLLLRGRLPFDIDGESREKIIERTINGTIDTEDTVWQALSDDARSLLLGLLNKDIRKRMSAKEALLHPWITSRVDRMQAEPELFDF